MTENRQSWWKTESVHARRMAMEQTRSCSPVKLPLMMRVLEKRKKEKAICKQRLADNINCHALKIAYF